MAHKKSSYICASSTIPAASSFTLTASEPSPAPTSIITYSNKGSYAVTLDQLRLLSSGVQKVRIEFTGEHVDSEYKKDKWGDPMALMLDEISQKTATNNVREGF